MPFEIDADNKNLRWNFRTIAGNYKFSGTNILFVDLPVCDSTYFVSVATLNEWVHVLLEDQSTQCPEIAHAPYPQVYSWEPLGTRASGSTVKCKFGCTGHLGQHALLGHTAAHILRGDVLAGDEGLPCLPCGLCGSRRCSPPPKCGSA